MKYPNAKTMKVIFLKDQPQTCSRFYVIPFEIQLLIRT